MENINFKIEQNNSVQQSLLASSKRQRSKNNLAAFQKIELVDIIFSD